MKAKNSAKKQHGRRDRDKHGRWLTTEGILLRAGNKLAKHRVATAVLKNTLFRSYHHQIKAMFLDHVKRLQDLGYPENLNRSLSNKLLTEERAGTRPKARKEYRTTTVIPYVHGVSHKLKRIVERSGVRVMFSAPNKFSGLCKAVNSEEPRRNVCNKGHTRRFIECATRAVYEIPLSCGGSYIGQTRRCVNDRLCEHANTSDTGSNLATHVTSCASEPSCEPLFEHRHVLKLYGGQRSREIFEAFSMHERVGACVSKPSVDLLPKEIAFLQS